MPKSPGQSAMEYILSYGWAILVVMIVGIVMWQIGIFNLGGSIPTTSDGFAQLKPMLASCKMGEDVWASNFDGFQCLFTNPLQTTIHLKDIDVTVNGEYCSRLTVHLTIPGWTDSYLNRWCTDGTPDVCENPAQCWNGHGNCVGSGLGSKLIIAGGSTFYVTHYNNVGVGETVGKCDEIESGNRYDAFVDLTYDVAMLGETVEKHSTGHIRGSME